MWKLYAILAAVFAAMTAILAKAGVRGVGSSAATAVRTAVALIMAVSVAAISGQLGGLKAAGKTSILCLAASGAATGLSWLFYFKALEQGNVSKVAPLDKLSVVFVIALSFLLLKEPLDLKTVVGGTLIAAGAIIIAA